METIKSLFWKPDPAAQLRKCNALIRKNTRDLDTHIRNLRALESKTLAAVKASTKSKHNTPAQTRLLAIELVRIRRQLSRLATSRAQLQSVGMQVNEAFGMRKIEGSIKVSTGVMKDVNSLVRLPELQGDMQQLSAELMKAGIIEEMTGDMLDVEEEVEVGEEMEEEVERIMGELVGGREMPVAPREEVGRKEEEVVEEEGQGAEEENMRDMQERLMKLKS